MFCSSVTHYDEEPKKDWTIIETNARKGDKVSPPCLPPEAKVLTLIKSGLFPPGHGHYRQQRQRWHTQR